MSLLLEVTEETLGPVAPEDGWSVGQLANLGVLLSADGFNARFDEYNLNLLFDYAEDGEPGEIRDHNGQIIEVIPTENGIILKVRDDVRYPYGHLLDLATLKELGIEQYEEEDDFDPTSEFDSLDADVKIAPDNDLEIIDEGVKRAYRRVGKKIKRGFRVTSGFRKGRVVASAAGAFKPRKKASTRMKLRIAARRRKIVRILKAKRTRMKPTSKRLVRLNKRIK